MGVSVGKWTKYRLMRKDEGLENYLPKTFLFTKKNFNICFNTYQEFVFKPNIGRMGKRVIMLTPLENGKCKIHEEYQSFQLEREEAYKWLRKKQRYYGPHILQQRIPLAAIGNQIFDLRIMVQRKEGTPTWEVTGKLARVAAKGFMIANVTNEILTVEEAIERSNMEIKCCDALLKAIDDVSLRTMKQLEEAYPTVTTVGLDIGLDRQGGIWIIEANLLPSISLFKRLEDQAMYKKILSFKKKVTDDKS